jgi:nucleotide-binding universal stress UspA family protein
MVSYSIRRSSAPTVNDLERASGTAAIRHPAARGRLGNGVLVPIIRGQAAAPLLSLGDAIAQQGGGAGTVLGLVEIPTTWLGLTTPTAERSRQLLRWIAATDYEWNDGGVNRLGVQTRISTDVAHSIREAVLETRCDAVVLEWPRAISPRRHRLAATLRNLVTAPPANLVLARADLDSRGCMRPRSVLAPVRGGPNAQLALAVAVALSVQAGAELTVMHVYDRTHHKDRQESEAAVFHELIRAMPPLDLVVSEKFADKPAQVLLQAAHKYDAVVMGTHASAGRAETLVGSELASVVGQLAKTVIMTRSIDTYAGPT